MDYGSHYYQDGDRDEEAWSTRSNERSDEGIMNDPWCCADGKEIDEIGIEDWEREECKVGPYVKHLS